MEKRSGSASKRSDTRTRTPFLVMLVFSVCALIALCVILVFLLRDLAALRHAAGIYDLEAASGVSYDAEDNAQADTTRTSTRVTEGLTVTQRYVLIGDSRTRGMNLATGISETGFFHVVAESNMGYHWLVSTALTEASYYACTNYVSLLGINDLGMIDSYLDTYRRLVTEGKHVILVTVGPVDEGVGGYTVTNEAIRIFNERLYEVEGAEVIDLYSYLIEQGYHTLDGVHYDDATYDLMEAFLFLSLD